MAIGKELLEFKTETGEIVYIETITTNEQEGRYVQASSKGNISQKATKTLEKALGIITPFANGVVQAVNNMEEKPNEVETIFKIAYASKIDVKIVSLGSDANLEVKLLWKKSSTHE